MGDLLISQLKIVITVRKVINDGPRIRTLNHGVQCPYPWREYLVQMGRNNRENFVSV